MATAPPIAADPGSSTARVARVLDGLRSAVRLAEAGRDDEALNQLHRLKPDTAALRLASREMHDILKSEGDFAQDNLKAALTGLAAATAMEETVQKHIFELRAQGEGTRGQLAELQTQLAAYGAEIASARRRIDELTSELRDNQDKLDDWWWVPGYNVYLAIENLRDLIDGKQGRLDSLRASVADIQKRLPTLERDRSAYIGQLLGLEAELKELQQQEHSLQIRVRNLERAQKAQAGAVASSEAVAFFHASLDVALQDVESDLESTYRLAERLADPAPVLAGGQVRQGTLEEALRELAGQTDRAAQRLELYSNVGDGQMTFDYPIGRMRGGAVIRCLFVAFRVTQFVHLRSVLLPIGGTDLIVQLAEGEPVEEYYRYRAMKEPRILLSHPLPGTLPMEEREIPIPGLRVLVPGQQYFILVTAADLETQAGAWRQGRQPTFAWGRHEAETVAGPDSGWILLPPGEKLGPRLRIYGSPAVGVMQVL